MPSPELRRREANAYRKWRRDYPRSSEAEFRRWFRDQLTPEERAAYELAQHDDGSLTDEERAQLQVGILPPLTPGRVLRKSAPWVGMVLLVGGGWLHVDGTVPPWAALGVVGLGVAAVVLGNVYRR